MSRRERLERKLEKRAEWAEKADTRSNAAFGRVRSIADGIPLGQPILVGHHSERRARRDADRIHGGMSKGCEEAKLAEHHRGKAMGLEAQLDGSIFSDDSNAVDALEARIAEREAQAARMKEINAAFKKAKGDAAKFAELAEISEASAAAIIAKIAAAPYLEKPYPSYSLSNLRANIRRDKARIEEVRRRAKTAEAAEEAGGVLVKISGDWATVTFAEKPDRAVINDLKAAGFHWSSGSWSGYAKNLPEEYHTKGRDHGCKTTGPN